MKPDLRWLAWIGSLVFLWGAMPTVVPVQSQSISFGSGYDICPAPVAPVVLDHPTLITNCTRAGIQAALDQGGEIAFDCGGGVVTIPIDQTLELNTHTDTVIDGGGKVTLDGQGQVRLFHKGWHDPVSVGTIQVTFQNLRLINGRAPGGGDTGEQSGGAINSGHPGTRLVIIDSTFENDTTTDFHTPDNQGGAIFSHNSYETVISGSVFQDNQAGNGGAIGGIATGLVVFNSRFTHNRAMDDTAGGIVRGYGGAIHLDGVSNGYNPNSSNRLHLCGNTFEQNSSIRGGGAVSVVISDNLGTRAIYEKSTFTDNQALGMDGSFGQGGAIYHIEDDHAGGSAEENLLISGDTFHGNQALRQGGAGWLSILGKGEVINSTFEGNGTSAPFNTVGQGGALAIMLGKIDITNTLFANNHAAYQGGAIHGGGDGDPNRVITLSNTIFVNNTLNEQDQPSPTMWQGYHTNRPMNDGGQNIQYPRLKPTYNNEVNNNITAAPLYVDPLLDVLQDNGGPTWTAALMPGSPAIDQGSPAACPVLDQRGYARHGQCDIGPFEFAGEVVSDRFFQYLPVMRCP